MDPDPDTHFPAAASWARYETVCSTLHPGPSASAPAPTREAPTGGSRAAWKSMLGIARIEVHYFVNNMFLEENYILDNLDKLKNLPVAIVQGRYDIICPVVTADRLADALKDLNGGNEQAVRYTIVDDAGHSDMEPGIRQALVVACDEFRGL